MAERVMLQSSRNQDRRRRQRERRRLLGSTGAELPVRLRVVVVTVGRGRSRTSVIGSVPSSLIGALDDDDDARRRGEGDAPESLRSKSPPSPEEVDDCDRDLPVVLRQLAMRAYRPYAPCPLSVLNQVDNMNYHGAEASLEILHEIRRRLQPDDSSTTSLMLADVGSGFGGTARVMCHALSSSSETTATATTCVAVELQRPIHETARVLSHMAELSGDVPPHAVKHVCGDAVTGKFDPPDLVPTDGSLDAVVSRLAILHVLVAGDAKVALLRRCASWLRPGGVLAIEDYAASDEMPRLTDETRRSLRDDVYVPDGILPTISGWREMLEDCGFVDIQIEDVTARWAKFVRERVAAAEGDDGGRAFDESMGGSEDLEAGRRRREFFRSVDRLFNPPEPNGLVGVRIYATKARAD